MLHHFGVEALLTHTAKVVSNRQQLTERRCNNIVHALKTLFARLLSQPAKDVGKFENKHVYMVVFYRNITPSACFQSQFARHLPRRKRHIPRVIPRDGEVSGFLTQVDIVFSLLALSNHSQIIGGCYGGNGGLLVFAIGIERRREVVALRDNVLLHIAYRSTRGLQIVLVAKVFPPHHQCRGSRRSATSRCVDVRSIRLKLTSEVPIVFY